MTLRATLSPAVYDDARQTHTALDRVEVRCTQQDHHAPLIVTPPSVVNSRQFNRVGFDVGSCRPLVGEVGPLATEMCALGEMELPRAASKTISIDFVSGTAGEQIIGSYPAGVGTPLRRPRPNAQGIGHQTSPERRQVVVDVLLDASD
jgi:hypothetical protein